MKEDMERTEKEREGGVGERGGEGDKNLSRNLEVNELILKTSKIGYYRIF